MINDRIADLFDYIGKNFPDGIYFQLILEDGSLAICQQNLKAISNADEVHIFYSDKSQGTHFDMGMSFALNKPIKIVESIPLTKGKSFQNLLNEWVENENRISSN